jgi:release factor glutamine methyltransferase
VIAGLGAEVKNYDPRLALDGGADGLFAYRALAAGAKMRLVENGVVAVEIGAGQGPDVTAIFSSNGFEPLGQRIDLGGHLRALTFR